MFPIKSKTSHSLMLMSSLLYSYASGLLFFGFWFCHLMVLLSFPAEVIQLSAWLFVYACDKGKMCTLLFFIINPMRLIGLYLWPTRAEKSIYIFACLYMKPICLFVFSEQINHFAVYMMIGFCVCFNQFANSKASGYIVQNIVILEFNAISCSKRYCDIWNVITSKRI